jgi:hypothetical protein
MHARREVMWHTIHSYTTVCQGQNDKLKYNRISLVKISCTILTNILHKQLVPYVEEILRGFQWFRSDQATNDTLIALKLTTEKANEFRLVFYLLFTDFRQTYATVGRQYFYETFKGIWDI